MVTLLQYIIIIIIIIIIYIPELYDFGVNICQPQHKYRNGNIYKRENGDLDTLQLYLTHHPCVHTLVICLLPCRCADENFSVTGAQHLLIIIHDGA